MKKPMTVSDARIEIAKDLLDIAKTIYANISPTEVNLDLDLSSFSYSQLRSFYLFTSGLVCIKDIDELLEMLSDDEIAGLLDGNFTLKTVNDAQAEEFLASTGAKPRRIPTFGRFKLYEIQDGTYHLICGLRGPKNTLVKKIMLETDPLEIHTDKKNSDLSEEEIIRTIRNVFAHDIPHEDGHKLRFTRGRDEICVSRMWLRGFSELFSQKSEPIDPKLFSDRLTAFYMKNHVYLENEQEVNAALSETVDLFDPEIRDHFFRVNALVKARIDYTPGFYQLPVEKKIELIASFLAFNPRSMRSSREGLNSSVIYAIESLISSELERREEYAFNEKELDRDFQKFFEQEAELDRMEEEFDRLEKVGDFYTLGRVNAYNRLVPKYNSLKIAQSKLLDKIRQRARLETLHMKLYDSAQLENLPVEVAFNVIGMMAYNALVTSSFSRDLLDGTDLTRLSREQYKFFSQFNFDKFDRIVNGKKLKTTNSEEKAFSLLTIRNALCHGGVTYTLPPKKRGENPDFRDAYVQFECEQLHTTIGGRLEDFYKLFSSNLFVIRRKDEILLRPAALLQGAEPDFDEPINDEAPDDEFVDDDSSSDEPGGDE